MSNNYRPPTDLAQHAAAVNVFTSEGGQLPPAANQAFPGDAEHAWMAAWGIHFDGRAFCFAGYRYSRLIDALHDARRTNPDGP